MVRPSFRYFHWATCLLGLLGTLAMLFLTSLIFAAISAVTSVIIIVLLHYTSPAKKENWGHISQALIFHQVCNTLSILLEKGRKMKMLIFHTRCASTCYFWTHAKTT